MVLAKSYFVKEYTKFLALTIGCAASLIFILDLAEVIRSGCDKYLLVTLSKTLQNTVNLMPLFALIGTIITFSTLSKRNELVIFTTLGLSNSFFLIAILGILIFLFGVVITVIMPITSEISLKIDDRANQRILFQENGVIFKSSQNTFIKIGSIKGDIVENVIIWKLGNDFSLQEVISANVGHFNDDELGIEAVNIDTRLSSEKIEKMNIPIDIKIRDIENSILKPNQISLLSIRGFLLELKKLGFSSEAYERYFWDKITIFINFFTMGLLGFISSFSLVSRLAKSMRIFYGIAAGLTIFFLQNLVISAIPFDIAISIIVAKIGIFLSVFLSTRFKKIA